MDFKTMKQKLDSNKWVSTFQLVHNFDLNLFRYPNKESFVADAQLVFANCEYYNEDDSEVVHYMILLTLFSYL